MKAEEEETMVFTGQIEVSRSYKGHQSYRIAELWLFTDQEYAKKTSLE